MSYFASNVIELRGAMSLSAEHLAVIVGSSTSQIRKVERGLASNPSYMMVDNLARFFGVTRQQLMHTDLVDCDGRLQALQRITENFNDEEWNVLLAMVDGITR